MPIRNLTASTALASVLGLLSPLPAAAQLLGGALADADARAICSDGRTPSCAAGAELLSLGEALQSGLLQGDAGAVGALLGGNAIRAICSDGAEATCEAGASILMPGAPGYDAAVRGEVEAEAEAEAVIEPEPEAEAEAVIEPEPEAEPEPEIAADPAPEVFVQPEPETETAVDPTPEVIIEPEPEIAAEPAPEPAPIPAPTAEAPAPETAPLGQQIEAEAARIVDSLLGQGSAAQGTGGIPLAALRPEGSAEAPPAETIETEVTEGDTRQSTEDFATDPAGRPGRTERDRSRDIERLAILGLGALAVGAILSNGDEVVGNTGDRVVVQRGDGDYYVLRDDDATLRQPGSNVRTERYEDGSSRTFVTRADGSTLITVRDASGRVVLREREGTDGRRVVLIDDTEAAEPVDITRLPRAERREVAIQADADAAALRAALDRAAVASAGRSFSLRQVREIPEVRKLVPEIAVRPITFQTASAAIRASEAESLAELGIAMARMIEDDPRELFLIEGHTDAVGGAAYNLALSDRRAESVALALTEYFGVPAENMVIQGYGFTDLLIPTAEAEVRNRRVAVRRITPLLDVRLARN